MTARKALITGISGQDGSYLAELLLSKGYEVHGIIRKASTFNTERLREIYQDPHDSARRLFLHYGDLSDGSMLARLLSKTGPDEIYNMGAQSHVRVSFDIPEYTADIDALGPLRLLDAIRDAGIKPKLYQASSSEMFGGMHGAAALTEESLLEPRSPYAASKCFAFWITRNYREAYGIHASNGILFNHESPRRGPTFVTRKITMGLARILAGRQKKIFLGNIDALRDWGYAPEFMEAVHRIVTHPKPDDFVVATGKAHSVRDFLDEAFGLARIKWQDHVEIDPSYFRPTEVACLVGSPAKAKNLLGWEARTGFKELVRIMLEADCKLEGAILPR
ncbi:MAG: GDP-mannose 4,6-dehydratase [Pseudomonadota bacterium]